MLNHPPEYFLLLHNSEQARLLAAVEHRRNAERRRAGTPDPMRKQSTFAHLLRRALRALQPVITTHRAAAIDRTLKRIQADPASPKNPEKITLAR
ncbi:hypothetical protein H4V95_002303 [Arthrobacter sp. CAN_C5]|nr:hypothetical protein [Arthrobacter sp. CAN_C5]